MAMTDFSISSKISAKHKNPPKYNETDDEKTSFVMENTSFGNSACPNGGDPHSLSLPNRKSIVSDPKKTS
uniref:Uncharacterized protein n=1 Tax=Panagrolaimus superbus TaxID=310955 RepID=A0A914YAB1_9BILA